MIYTARVVGHMGHTPYNHYLFLQNGV